MFLNDDVFKSVIASTPLVSIDLIIKDVLGSILLGKRTNSPAKGSWFVPGGRIYKNESIEQALNRISLNEVGVSIDLDKCILLGVYEHFYKDGFYSKLDSTHYVVLGLETTLSTIDFLPSAQHSDYKWFSEADVLMSNDVHQNTKEYFLSKGVI